MPISEQQILTPRHNLLQSKFLDNKFCNACLDEFSYNGKYLVKKYNGYRPFCGGGGCYKVEVNFEVCGWDVRLHFEELGDEHHEIFFEIKTTLGDDFAEALRQMKRNEVRLSKELPQSMNSFRHYGLMYKDYVSVVDVLDVTKIFGNEGFLVMSFDRTKEWGDGF